MDRLNIVNIAAYKFAPLADLLSLRDELRVLCKSLHLRGTILLAPEGINLFVAGERQAIDALLTQLRAVPGLAELEVKESYSAERPFNRMLVKIKREIIAFGVADVDPATRPARRISPQELKRWLDEGRAVTLLDTRNDFEVQAGTFTGALAVGVDDFRDFPAAAARLPAQLRESTVVTFCTGGIRCEKAAPFLEQAGFADVVQLDGGILKYFADCGDAHYDGACFVFDKRVALDAALRETDLRQCFACQAILSKRDQQSAEYVEGKSCPHCFRGPAREQAELLALRHDALRAAACPLPGSVPYDHARPLSVPARHDGLELLEFLAAMRTHLTVDQWREVCAAGRLQCRGKPVQPGRIVRAGERLLHTTPAACEPDVAATIEILYEDDALVVINKPAPLPMHPCGRFNRNTLSYLLEQVYAPLRLRPAHRLDADTSGVVVFSKSREVASRLQPQFEAGSVRKQYLARIVGCPQSETFACELPIPSVPGPAGVRLPVGEGLPASTQFQLLAKLADGSSLVTAEPLSGRTNQIRAHLWSLGLPVLGDPMYLRNHKVGVPQTTALGEPPLCLHAWRLEFVHPTSGAPCRFEAPAPAWAGAMAGTAVPG